MASEWYFAFSYTVAHMHSFSSRSRTCLYQVFSGEQEMSGGEKMCLFCVCSCKLQDQWQQQDGEWRSRYKSTRVSNYRTQSWRDDIVSLSHIVSNAILSRIEYEIIAPPYVLPFKCSVSFFILGFSIQTEKQSVIQMPEFSIIGIVQIIFFNIQSQIHKAGYIAAHTPFNFITSLSLITVCTMCLSCVSVY